MGEQQPRRSVLRRAGCFAGAIAVIAVLGAGYAWAVHRWARVSAEALPATVRAEAAVDGAGGAVPWPKQTDEHCGAYALAVAIGLATRGQDAPPGEMLVPVVSHEISWSSRLSGTLPSQITAEAARRRLRGYAHTARDARAEQRLDLVKRHVADRRPTIVLYESERGTQHYVVVVGYAPETVHLYDPNWRASPDDVRRTKDENGAAPGNVSLPEAVFLDRWSRGGIAGLYTWWYFPVGPPPEVR